MNGFKFYVMVRKKTYIRILKNDTEDACVNLLGFQGLPWQNDPDLSNVT